MCFLFMMINLGLHRLNLVEFRRKRTKYPRLRELARVRFEQVEFCNGWGEVISKGELPHAMQHQVIGSQIYLVRGFNSDTT